MIRTLYKRNLKTLNTTNQGVSVFCPVCACKVIFSRLERDYLRKYPGGKEAWGQALDNMLKEARQVLVSVVGCQLLLLTFVHSR